MPATLPSPAVRVQTAATAVTALAARVAHDPKLAGELVEAQHARDLKRVQELLGVTGVPVQVSFPTAPPEADAVERLRISGGITVTHGGDGWSVSVTLTVSK